MLSAISHTGTAGTALTAALPSGQAVVGATGMEGLRRATHFSLPSPTTAILLLSSVQAMSLIFPAKGWYSYLRRCSFWVVSQILSFPETSGDTAGQVSHPSLSSSSGFSSLVLEAVCAWPRHPAPSTQPGPSQASTCSGLLFRLDTTLCLGIRKSPGTHNSKT